MMTATEWRKPLSTVAFVLVFRLRRHSNQFVRWERSSSPILIGPGLSSPGRVTHRSARLMAGLSSWFPFSSTTFQRGLPYPPMFTRVAFFPMIREKLSESFPKLVE